MPRRWENGISHRSIHIWLIILIVVWSGTVVFFTIRLTNTFLSITGSSKQTMELQKAAHELMNASDYLTEQVQRFTINGDIEFLENYFTEAFESKRREEAISRMDVDESTKAALKQLKEAMDNSVKLMDLEYYAMRLVIDARGYTDYPEILKGIEINEADALLSSEDKIRRASELVLGDDYYEQKDRIRKDMQESLSEVDKLAKRTEDAELASLKHDLRIVRTVIIIQALFIFFMLWLTTHLGIKPI
ncbi:MAG: hypothetical protein K6G22_12790, partial [Lachnospiraceae bacterium]|nr:hypothetical protein [Lachnospiraceae bacterium]